MAAAAALRRTVVKNSFLSFSPIVIRNKLCTSSSSFRYSRSICSGTTQDGGGGGCSNKNNMEDNTLILKEDFEVGSQLISLKTGNMVLSGYHETDVQGHGIAVTDTGKVVMDMEDTKLLSVVKVGENKITQHFPHVDVLYDEDIFLYAQKRTHFAQKKKFPSEKIMMRPQVDHIIDMSIRSLFPARDYLHDVLATMDVLKSNGEHDPIIMAVNTMSAALMLSGIVWGGPIGVVRIGRSDSGEFVINPTMDQISECNDLNLVYACTRDKTLMIELQACEISNRDLAATLRLAHREAVKYLEPQIRLAARANKKEYTLYMTSTTDDQSRTTVLVDKNKVKCCSLTEPHIEEATNPSNDKKLYGDNDKEVVGKADVDDTKLMEDLVAGSRIIEKAGLTLTEITAPLYCQSGTLPVIYGSSLFWLGDTQVLCRVKLETTSSPSLSSSDDDGDDDYFDFLELRFKYAKIARFWLNGVNHRWDGLTHKAFYPVLPLEDDFPYQVGIYADDMVASTAGYGHGSSCSGTTYTATVCGSSLALMDAGIPLKRHVAGVSIGLVSKADPSTGMIKDYPIFLTDIDATRGHDDELGMENSMMDLKIAGTRKGVTAIHLDIKKPPAAAAAAAKTGTAAGNIGIGIPLDIICECLEPALKVRLQILDHMERAIDAPRHTPSSTFVKNGWHWRTPDDSNNYCSRKNKGWYSMDSLGSLQSAADADDQADLHAKRNQTTTELMSSSYKEKSLEKVVDHVFVRKGFKVGGIHEGAVFSIKEEDGAFVEVDGTSCIGFLPVSELLHDDDDDDKLKMMQVSIGQRLSVMCIGYDTRGFLKLSLKTTVLPQNEEQLKN